jgi:hypothetical protein
MSSVSQQINGWKLAVVASAGNLKGLSGWPPESKRCGGGGLADKTSYRVTANQKTKKLTAIPLKRRLPTED